MLRRCPSRSLPSPFTSVIFSPPPSFNTWGLLAFFLLSQYQQTLSYLFYFFRVSCILLLLFSIPSLVLSFSCIRLCFFPFLFIFFSLRWFFDLCDIVYIDLIQWKPTGGILQSSCYFSFFSCTLFIAYIYLFSCRLKQLSFCLASIHKLYFSQVLPLIPQQILIRAKGAETNS